jgi:DNA modification methylase
MNQIISIPLKNLTLLEKNPRKINAEQMAKLEKSLTDDPSFLERRPVLVNKVNDVHIVYAGNQRVRAAKKLKWKDIPCIVDENLSDDVMKDRVIKDNKTFGEFDFEMLANEFDIEKLLDAGFTPEELHIDIQDLGSTDEEEGELLEPPKDPKTKLGDLYELGSHRLKCGDSTNPDDVVALLADAIPILMVTDPPYGVNYDASWREKLGSDKGNWNKNNVKWATKKVKNDDNPDWRLAYSLFPGSIAYIWHSGCHAHLIADNIIDCEFQIIYQIIWVKQSGFSRGDYHWYHEPCWVAVRKGHKHNWQGSRKERTVWEIQSRAALGNTSEMEEATGHSTQKPLECMARPIRNNTSEGEGVYDPFLGSGTTLIACEKLNRICYGMELDPAYCDIIVQRWMKLTGNKVKRNGEEINSL